VDARIQYPPRSPVSSREHNRFQQLTAPSHLARPTPAHVLPQHHVGGAEAGANISGDLRPLKKDWELEVERLRLAMQNQEVTGMSCTPSAFPPTLPPHC
jgi:hypothetical protein